MSLLGSEGESRRERALFDEESTDPGVIQRQRHPVWPAARAKEALWDRTWWRLAGSPPIFPSWQGTFWR